jgi:hypothetical protein
MNIVAKAFMDHLPVGSPMRDSASLALIDRICALFEAAENDDTMLAAEVMRIIRAVATGGRVTILSNGPAATLLSYEMAGNSLFWAFVSVEDDSVPESAH